jgi:hypothetical protein
VFFLLLQEKNMPKPATRPKKTTARVTHEDTDPAAQARKQQQLAAKVERAIKHRRYRQPKKAPAGGTYTDLDALKIARFVAKKSLDKSGQ